MYIIYILDLIHQLFNKYKKSIVYINRITESIIIIIFLIVSKDHLHFDKKKEDHLHL